jgi:iron(III) transport system substrate-binding protein
VPIGEHVARLGIFIPDSQTPVSAFKAHATEAQTIFNEVGWD